jgi:transcriptional regulator with XRE-family HTH domain
MDLREYLKLNKIKQKNFADDVGISEAYISLILSGRRMPSVPVALQIEKASKGKVRAIDILKL